MLSYPGREADWGVRVRLLGLVIRDGVATAWAMPLMFVIAGFSIRSSLQKRTAATFLQDRVQRLLVPLIFGVVVVVPPQVYVHLLQADPSAGLTYWEFLPRFFDVRLCPDLFGLVCADPASGLFTVAHLWFLSDLFLFSLLLLPLFWYLQPSASSGARH